MTPHRQRVRRARHKATSAVIELLVLALGVAIFYGIVRIGHSWTGPFKSVAEISLNPWELPKYAGYSTARIALAYFVSLIFSLGYGYAAAYNAHLERILIPALDVLQSIPVLSFLPAVILAAVALFPNNQLGVELGTIVLIFTGQAWNIAFSFYSSLKSIPTDLREVSKVYQWGRWQRFVRLELPYSAIGLVWNSMMSVAGGWFFLMACEMFQLGNRDFRLEGLGSYLQVASTAGDWRAIIWGLIAMIGVIVLLDRIVWSPVIAWSEKFKFEQTARGAATRSLVLTALRRSIILKTIATRVAAPVVENLGLIFRRPRRSAESNASRELSHWVLISVLFVALASTGYGLVRAGLILSHLTTADFGRLGVAAIWTFVRVNVALLCAAIWTIPAGVAIGFSPRLAKIAQPMVQIAASIPATALFPVLLLILIEAGRGIGAASVVLMLLAAQWYILFNVIGGAMAIPTELREAASVFHLGWIARWRVLILPGIFPYLITGLITASGGAWNASIIAEYFELKGRIFSTTGLGETISNATATGDFVMLLAATILMSAIVVAMNHFVWHRFYHTAQTRFVLES